MPTPSEQQRLYTRLSEVFGPQWAEQNWGQFASMLNDPSVGTSGVDAFIDRVNDIRQEKGLDTMGPFRFEPKQYGLEEGDRELEAAGIAEDAPGLQQQLLQLANSPNGAMLIDQLQPQLEQAAEGGFDETEQVALGRMLEGMQRQVDARQADPDRFATERAAESFYDPYTAQADGPASGDQRNQNLGYMNPQHLQDYYQSAVSGVSGEDVAGAQLGTDVTGDTIGDMMASMDYYQQQAQRVLNDPNASAAEKEQAQAALSQAGGLMPSMLRGLEYLGPGSVLDLPGGFDTRDLTGPELTASLQMGGINQVADPRKWLRGGLGALAARALMPDMARSSAVSNIQHGDQTSTGFGTGGYYEAPTREQAVENAWQAINAHEMETGQELSDADRTTMVQQYIDAAAKNQELEDDRIQGFTQNMLEGRPGEQAEALLPQMIGRPSDFAQQASAMDVGGRTSGYGERALRHPIQTARQIPGQVRQGVQQVAQGARRAPGVMGRAMQAARTPMQTGRQMVQTGTRSAMGATGRGVANFGQAMGRLGPMGLATGALSAMPIGQDQAAIAASGTGGPSWGTKALGAGAGGLSMLSTEAALPQAMRGIGQIGQATGVNNLAGAAGRGVAGGLGRLTGMQGAGRAMSQAFNTGRVSPLMRQGATRFGRIGQAMGNLGRGIATGARNLTSLPGRAMGAARAAFNPAARAAAMAAPTSRALQGGAQMGRLARLGQFGSGLKNLGGGALLAQAGIDAALNAGDAYTSLFGGQRGRQLVQQGNEMLADQAGQRGFWGNVAAAPNVVSQTRTMMGLNEQANQANRRASGTAQRGASTGRDIANWRAFETAARDAGLDPSTYQQVQREMGGDEEFFNRYLETDPEMQQAHQLYQQTQQDRARRRGTAGFSFDEGQKLTDYVSDTGGFWSRAFGGANEGAMRSMSEVYQDAPEELQASMRNLAQAVERGDIDASEATHYLNIGASNQRDELIQQMREAGML